MPVMIRNSIFNKRKYFFVMQKRYFNLQENQSKMLMSEFNINVQRFVMADSASSAFNALKTFKMPEYVIKAQILAGGRGKGTFSNGFKGGVHLTKNPNEVPDIISKMVGFKLVTPQTPKDGVKVNNVMIAEALDISRETYLAILMDRSTSSPMIVVSAVGGVNIEELANKNPEAIHREIVDIVKGVTDEQANVIARKLGFTLPEIQSVAAAQIKRLYEMFINLDCTQVEVNPFGETPDGRVVCFDAKLSFDSAGVAVRHPRLRQLAAESQATELAGLPVWHPSKLEAMAETSGLNYISISDTDVEHNIGCMVNGAGLAMATMDIVHLYGGRPANFLDLGGGVTQKQVETAFSILTADPRVNCILVNIFGGIVNCATVAEGLLTACTKQNLRVPLVVRLEGNSVLEARRLLAAARLPSGVRIRTAGDLDEAARLAVRTASSVTMAAAAAAVSSATAKHG